MGRAWRGAAVVAVVLALAAVGCSADDAGSGTAPTTVPSASATPVDYSQPGPYAVGTASMALADRGGRNVAVAYPAQGGAVSAPTVAGSPPTPPIAVPGAPAAGGGPFPVVLYSHGLGSTNAMATSQLRHLASWGFVVAAPEHAERDLIALTSGRLVSEGDDDVTDLRATIALVRAEGARPDSPLSGAVDAERVGAIGHSAGGRAILRLAVVEPTVKTWIGQAPAPPVSFEAAGIDLRTGSAEAAAKAADALGAMAPPTQPSMIIAADADAAIPLAVVQVEEAWLPAPKALVVLANTGHNTFTDICPFIRQPSQGSGTTAAATTTTAAGDDGGLSGIVQLGKDGCSPDDLDPKVAILAVDHLQVAQMRAVLADDPAAQASLVPSYVEGLFPGTIASYQVDR